MKLNEAILLKNHFIYLIGRNIIHNNNGEKFLVQRIIIFPEIFDYLDVYKQKILKGDEAFLYKIEFYDFTIRFLKERDDVQIGATEFRTLEEFEKNYTPEQLVA